MKNSIKLTALLVLASVSVFAASPAKVKSEGPSAEAVTVSSLPSLNGVAVKVDGNETSKAVVIINDQDGTPIFKDVLSTGKSMEKGYILNQLEDGDYTLEITANHKTTTQKIHVYEDQGSKEFFIQQ